MGRGEVEVVGRPSRKGDVNIVVKNSERRRDLWAG